MADLWSHSSKDRAVSSRFYQQRNAAFLQFHTFAKEEIPRLRQKTYYMELEKIDRIPYAVLGEKFEALEAYEQGYRARILAAATSFSPSLPA
jgi:hypothetical protein